VLPQLEHRAYRQQELAVKTQPATKYYIAPAIQAEESGHDIRTRNVKGIYGGGSWTTAARELVGRLDTVDVQVVRELKQRGTSRRLHISE
jgi:hypothetical protein